MTTGRRPSATIGAYMSPHEKGLFERIASTRRIPPSRLAGEILRKWMAEWGRGGANIPARTEELGPLTDMPAALRAIEERVEAVQAVRAPVTVRSPQLAPPPPARPVAPTRGRR